MRSYGKSDVGRIRKTNEDSYVCYPPDIFMVADGMGGHAAGEIASNLCTEAVAEYLKKNSPQKLNWQEVIKLAIFNANSIIWQAAQTKNECFGMGTTITAVHIDGDNVSWGHVGDSRLYLVRDEKIQQITEDHSIVWELVKKGKITNAEAQVHPKRNILTRAVGTCEEIQVDTGMMAWQAKDKLLLCSDGLTNMVPENEILDIISSQKIQQSPDLIVDELVAKANASGGSDNITAILITRDE